MLGGSQHRGRCLRCHLARVANTSSLCLSPRGTSLCRTLCQADTDTHPPRAKPNFRPHPPPPLFRLPWRAKRRKKHSFITKHCLASLLSSSELIVITELGELNFLLSVSNCLRPWLSTQHLSIARQFCSSPSHLVLIHLLCKHVILDTHNFNLETREQAVPRTSLCPSSSLVVTVSGSLVVLGSRMWHILSEALSLGWFPDEGAGNDRQDGAAARPVPHSIPLHCYGAGWAGSHRLIELQVTMLFPP